MNAQNAARRLWSTAAVALPARVCDGDLAHTEALWRGAAGCRWVFHVAAPYSYWGHSWDEFYQANVEGYPPRSGSRSGRGRRADHAATLHLHERAANWLRWWWVFSFSPC